MGFLPRGARRCRAAAGGAIVGDGGEADGGEANRARTCGRVWAAAGAPGSHLAARRPTTAPNGGPCTRGGAVARGLRQHWRSVERVWLGAGSSRRSVTTSGGGAKRGVRLGVNQSKVDAHHMPMSALLGAARTRATPAPRAIVLDFGYSSVSAASPISRRRAAAARGGGFAWSAPAAVGLTTSQQLTR